MAVLVLTNIFVFSIHSMMAMVGVIRKKPYEQTSRMFCILSSTLT